MRSISGGNDKEGFAMVQGVLTMGRVRLLLGASKSVLQNTSRLEKVM